LEVSPADSDYSGAGAATVDTGSVPQCLEPFTGTELEPTQALISNLNLPASELEKLHCQWQWHLPLALAVRPAARPAAALTGRRRSRTGPAALPDSARRTSGCQH